LLSSRGISTPSLQAQGEQRLSSYFNIHRDIAFVCLERMAGRGQVNQRATRWVA
jgi:hypothetical protein